MRGKSSSEALVKLLKKERRELRRAYAKSLSAKEKSPFDEWLSDNYYLFEREIRPAAAALKNALPPCGADGLPLIYTLCIRICENGVLPIQEELTEKLEPHKLRGCEAELLPVMLRCVLLHYACKSIRMEGGEATELIGNTVKSMRSMPDIDFDALNERLSPVEKLLLLDPAGIYKDMADETKSLYRYLISRQARKNHTDEEQIALRLLENARAGTTEAERHIGNGLFDNGRGRKIGSFLIIMENLLPIIAAAVTSLFTGELYPAVLLYLPFRALISAVTGAVSPYLTKTLPLPRMETDNKVPNDSKTLITVSVLLHGAESAKKLKRHLRELWLSNGGENVKICLLADLKSAGTPERPEDKAEIAAVKRAIDELNESLGGGFILAVRPRVYSATQGCFSGWERKRGAITQLIREIKGEGGGFLELYGDTGDLNETVYLFALDSDTKLPLDTTPSIVSVARHPLSRPVINESLGAVTSGYGILAPGVGVTLGSSTTTFSKVMAGEFGFTAYDSVVSERYQDFFGEGIFSGKGLIDVDAFYRLLNDTLPEEKILSHDILEGCFLRCGYVSDIQVTDGFPKRQTAYYDRMERWIRGDWQNGVFIFGNNPLNGLSRYKLIDNLLRSFTPVAAAVAVLLSGLMNSKAAAVTVTVCLLAAAGGNFLSAARTVIKGGTSMLSRLYYSPAMPAALADLTRGAALLGMLPQTAWTSLCGVFRALWRSAVSKKRMLEWTTFAQSDRMNNDLKTILRCLPSLISSVFLLVFPSPYSRLCGLIFLSGTVFLLFSGKEKEKKGAKLSYFDRDRLNSYAAAMWRYFEELCTPENNWLPPDNMQETPVYRTANRTSPTNIGFMLLCTLAARDLGLIESGELYERLSKSLASVEKLEKYEGNLLNWYDTRSLKPLFPRYLSCVDSGNLLCCLTALKEGLREYLGEKTELAELIVRIERLISDTDISVFYNRRRRLFHIGIDYENNELSPSFYDLLMSEARMTGYFAISSKYISKKHWGALGRTLVGAGRYTGLASWTGTMFEYFMPYIFLPAPEGTLGFEALKFCAWCQKKRTEGREVPWGISESGFYAFDRQLNYQYKAHGVQKLGLKRGLDNELVISPYSTFLVLPLEPSAAMKNLRRLEDMEMTGRCGFYEAADFTPVRTNGQDYTVVRSYMAHHVGMSMLSILNTLKGNIIQKRFMADDNMSSGECLLYEKIPIGASVFKDIEMRNIPKTRERTEPQKREFELITPAVPHVKLLTNGEWTSAVTDVGASMSLYRRTSVFRHSPDLLRDPQGVFALLKSDSLTLPVVNALGYQDDVEYKCEFSNAEVEHSAEKDGVSVIMKTSVHPRISGEQRTFIIKNKRQGTLNAELIIYFEPSLAPVRDAKAHPAFSKLFIEDRYDAQNKILTFTRRPRGEEHTISLAAGFLENVVFSFETSRVRLLKSGEGTASLLCDVPEFRGAGGIPDVCGAFRIKVKLPQRGAAEVNLLLAASSTESEAINKILKMRETGGIKSGKGAPELLREGSMETVIGDPIIPCLLYGPKITKESADAVSKNRLGRNAVWAFGVSGDDPVIYIEVHNVSDTARAVPYIRLNDRLRRAGIMSDLVIGYREGGEYDTPIFSAIREAFRNEKAEDSLINGGGAHIINLSNYSTEEVLALKAAASYIAPKTQERLERREYPFVPVVLSRTQLPKKRNQSDNVKIHRFTDEGIIIGEDNKKPCVPWSLVLANPSFGTLVSDKSLGFTWAVNSRENKLTPWSNDTRTDNTGEMLILKFRNKSYDLIRNSTVEFCPDYARYTGKAGEVEYEVTVKVPEKGMMKVCELKLKNKSPVQIKTCAIYYTEPVLGVDREHERFVRTDRIGSGIVMTSAYSEIKGFAELTVDGEADFFCTDRMDFWRSEDKKSRRNSTFDVCAAVGKDVWLGQDEEKTVVFRLMWAAKRDAVIVMKRVRASKADENGNYLRLSSPDKALDRMINTWLPHQILSSRIYGRTGFYQSGGAWGFRDQLQDCTALIMLKPELVKRHIYRCAAVQFEEGDVLHWWHKMPVRNGIKGVRTRYSDDMLWLPYAVAEYTEKTGDMSILRTKIRYLRDCELSAEENERYFCPSRSDVKGSVYEHCVRATERAMKTGAHGLALIGGGDWNDGFNRIGIGGKGESVWLSQFLAIVLRKMAVICRYAGDTQRESDYIEYADRLTQAVDKNAWDGERYLRAFFDDGTPLGTRAEGRARQQECVTDSLSQSFAVFADMPDKEKTAKALDTAVRDLVDEKSRIIKLLAPPFTGRGLNAGYITAYPMGIRENGGQYTHAAVWLCMALIRSGRKEEGIRLLRMINPASICDTEEGVELYRAEPYALAGDVSANETNKGCTGWSLYTGSAAWYYRAVCEEILGIRIMDEKIFLNPQITKELLPCKVEMRIKYTDIMICIESERNGKLFVDEKPADFIPIDQKSHIAVII